MKQALILTLLCVFGGFATAEAQDVVHRDDLSSVFEEHGVTGSFAMLDVADNQLTLVDADRAQTRFIPASTFKIANSLIALETGVIADADEVIPYGGEPQPLPQWEKDMSIRDAIVVSNVPVYQELARRVGLERYTDYLQKLDFGNAQVGESVETFWLRGPLEISAVEQAGFLSKLAQQELPLSERSQSLVRDIIRVESQGDATLYGKTGWTTAPDPDIGWFVGWVERGDAIHTYALNIDMRGRTDAPKRALLAKALLDALEVYGSGAPDVSN